MGLLARAERNIPASGSFAKAPSEPTVSSISVGGLWALSYVIDWHTKRFVRECFYPRERFTLEPANTLQLFVYYRGL